ncbi:hypothetical protein THAOC_18679 [Thalassiosira oceanica]|uniref:Methyltransferase domain-containing protein n=1 Tax=Thalassiosira oceanica TaxID=159749 RepID=K0S7I9_THAOC|nr:hypothetical protein THAOC_18679 [Thalassiosira oceanica]|eukprot:EJK60904.1 hypothetical protein THAOC_18679 [Thalassiosira oceanica]
MALQRTSSNARAGGVLSTVGIVVITCVVILSLQHLGQLTTDLTATTTSLVALDSEGNSAPGGLRSPSGVSSSPFGVKIPEGLAVALPSVPTTADEEKEIKRSIYGGAGDKAHLGGFTSFDPQGVSPTLWKHMVEHLGVKSMLDLGCGRGISTSWFITHGLEYVVCAEGSHDAVTQSLLPKIANVPKGTTYDLVEHDFSRGPWWPSRTAAIIFVTHSNWGGWHHVEVHDDDWWRAKMEAAGFVYSESLTLEMKDKAKADVRRNDLTDAMKKSDNKSFSVAQHLWTTMQVFINPLVASLPEHAHLFAEHGCYRSQKGQECGKPGIGPGVSDLTPLPEHFKPLQITEEMDHNWSQLIKDLPLPS